MPVRLPSRRFVRWLLVAATIATVTATTFLMTGLMADASAGEW